MGSAPIRETDITTFGGKCCETLMAKSQKMSENDVKVLHQNCLGMTVPSIGQLHVGHFCWVC